MEKCTDSDSVYILYGKHIFRKGTFMKQSYRPGPEDGYEAKPALAMGYVPWQHFTRAYEPQKAWKAGTIFPELDKPFLGAGGRMR
jgi:hypothetical protein